MIEGVGKLLINCDIVFENDVESQLCLLLSLKKIRKAKSIMFTRHDHLSALSNQSKRNLPGYPMYVPRQSPQVACQRERHYLINYIIICMYVCSKYVVSGDKFDHAFRRYLIIIGHHLFSDTISYFFGYMISDIRGHSFSDMHFSDIQFSDMIYSFFGYVKHSFSDIPFRICRTPFFRFLFFSDMSQSTVDLMACTSLLLYDSVRVCEQ